MTSAITATQIDETYPVAGIDNDTQGFRDNFNYIKIGLSTAADEITALQANTAKLNADNDFNNQIQSGAVFKDNQYSLSNYGTGSGIDNQITLNFGNADYQFYRLDDDVTFIIDNTSGFSASNMQKIVLELASDGGSYTVDFSSGGDYLIKKNPSYPTTLTVDSSSNPVLVEVITRAKAEDPGSLGRVIFLNYIGQFE